MASAQATIPTGPDVGETVPTFEASDHLGRTQTLSSLQGKNGLLLIFSRSVDW